jgi:hypothetical protein
MHRSVDQRFDPILVHQSDLHFTSEFTIFSGFRVIVYKLSCTYIILYHIVKRMMTHVVISASPNQDRSLKLICYSLNRFSSSIYDYEQISFINYKDL